MRRDLRRGAPRTDAHPPRAARCAASSANVLGVHSSGENRQSGNQSPEDVTQIPETICRTTVASVPTTVYSKPVTVSSRRRSSLCSALRSRYNSPLSLVRANISSSHLSSSLGRASCSGARCDPALAPAALCSLADSRNIHDSTS